MIKAVLLLSGGLDSALAGKVVIDMGIEVHAFSAISPFCRCTPGDAGCEQSVAMAKQLNIPEKLVSIKDEYLEIVKNPKHGWGKGVNPCVDCRILLFKKAKEFMEKIGASFLITGEVLGQRPKSQHFETMKLIDREAGVEGIVLRPLSAKLLEPTIAEKNGWVDREKLLSIKGRSRKPQLEMALKFGLRDYACGGSGCLLTDPVFSRRAKDAINHGEFNMKNIPLLTRGRHFRLPGGARFVVGRNKKENEIFSRFAQRYILVASDGVPTATGVIMKTPSEEDKKIASSIILRYSAAPPGKNPVLILSAGAKEMVVAEKISEELLEKLRI